MTLSILASVVIAVTLPISYGFVKGASVIYARLILRSTKMLNASSF